mmetsp:Transcript_30853/g.97006  ORF Transcript_30853/g.97006 Transcript_30853/m.97006 type:complete len:266 (-) Transcript_30853:2-799(-)
MQTERGACQSRRISSLEWRQNIAKQTSAPGSRRCSSGGTRSARGACAGRRRAPCPSPRRACGRQSRRTAHRRCSRGSLAIGRAGALHALRLGRVVHELLHHLLHRVPGRLPVRPVAVGNVAELHAQRALLEGDHSLVVRLPLVLRVHDAADHLTLALTGVDALLHAVAGGIDGHGPRLQLLLQPVNVSGGLLAHSLAENSPPRDLVALQQRQESRLNPAGCHPLQTSPRAPCPCGSGAWHRRHHPRAGRSQGEESTAFVLAEKGP